MFSQNVVSKAYKFTLTPLPYSVCLENAYPNVLPIVVLVLNMPLYCTQPSQYSVDNISRNIQKVTQFHIIRRQTTGNYSPITHWQAMRLVFAGKRRTPSHKLFETLAGRILKDSYSFQGDLYSQCYKSTLAHRSRPMFSIDNRFKP